MSTPAASCSFMASSVASRLARASSSPFDFQGAQSVLGSASHSGFGSEPAIVVGKSIVMSPDVVIWALSATAWARGTYAHPAPPFLLVTAQWWDGRDVGAKQSFVASPDHDRIETSTTTNSILGWAHQNDGKSHDRPLLRADA